MNGRRTGRHAKSWCRGCCTADVVRYACSVHPPGPLLHGLHAGMHPRGLHRLSGRRPSGAARGPSHLVGCNLRCAAGGSHRAHLVPHTVGVARVCVWARLHLSRPGCVKGHTVWVWHPGPCTTVSLTYGLLSTAKAPHKLGGAAARDCVARVAAAMCPIPSSAPASGRVPSRLPTHPATHHDRMEHVIALVGLHSLAKHTHRGRWLGCSPQRSGRGRGGPYIPNQMLS